MSKTFSKLSVFVFVFSVLLVALPAPAMAQVYKTFKECATLCISSTYCQPSQGGYACIEPNPVPPAPAEGTVINPIAPNVSPSSGDAAIGLFSKLIQSLVSTLIIVAAVVFFFMFLIGAIKWITSSGDKAQIESARGTILNALVGLVIVFSVFALLTLLEKLFKINILQIDAGALRIK